MPRNVILRSFLSPGDICTLTAAVESLHATYPGLFRTDVRTSCDAIFAHNPLITHLEEERSEVFDMEYGEMLRKCDRVPTPFLRGYCHHLSHLLDIPLELTTNRPHLYLSETEARPFGGLRGESLLPRGPFWVINAGTKSDYTLKQWPVEYFQTVIDHFHDRIQFIQIGSSEHNHPNLRNVISLVGWTTPRELIRVCYHSQGGIGPITFLQHLCAAFEKPYVALLGGREPVSWVQYPLQTTLHTLGKLSCCRSRACWKSRVVPLHDGSDEDRNLCLMPVTGMERPVGRCMAMITPAEVIRAIEGYCGILQTQPTRCRHLPVNCL